MHAFSGKPPTPTPYKTGHLYSSTAENLQLTATTIIETFWMSIIRTLLLSGFIIALAACSDSDSNNEDGTPTVPPQEPEYLPINKPLVSMPPDEGSLFLLAQSFDLADVGYEDAEYFLSGTATAFTNLSELTSDGLWEVEAAETAEYKTRIVVQRPLDNTKFSGTVIIEWLNVTSGFDIPPSWGSGHVEMYRSGHAWVGVSAQLVGIEGREGSLAPLSLKAVNPARYGELSHPGDSFSYDMFSQVSELLRAPGDLDVLAGLNAEYLLAVGESQSAGRLVTYINALSPVYRAYDGYIVHSRGSGSSALAQAPLVPIDTPDAPRIREDINVPVMTFETETDVTALGYKSARQDDRENFVLWEVAGTAHADFYTIISGRSDALGEPQFAAVVEANEVPGVLECGLPVNSGPMHYVFNTAIRAMDRWIRGGEPPPVAPRLDLNNDDSDFLRDANGNSTGGIQTPFTDAASAVLSGTGNTGDGFCRLFGTTALFPPQQMASLYVDEAGYTEAVRVSTERAVSAGFILPEDAQDIIDWAPEQWRAQITP